MTEYRETYNELKKNINSENSKVISYLFFGILVGRAYEKYRKIKKTMLNNTQMRANLEMFLDICYL